ncbi:MAG: hypothetical protein IIC46_09380 [Planctomycetes bacterium]|nr:hypothetical protein [Planctomycetota bacterium]
MSVAVAILLLVTVPVVAAALLRWARCPGWAVLGGAVAGIVLGPSIFGRALPAQFQTFYVGGIEQQAELEHFVRRQQADAIAAEHAGAGPERLAELTEQQKLARDGLDTAWNEAKWADQRPLRAFTVAVVVLTLLGAGPRSGRNDGQPRNLVASMSVGAWSAGLPGGLAFAAMYWPWHRPLSEAVLVGAAVAIGPWVLTLIDREAADQAELGGAHMIQRAGLIATLLAIAAVGWGLWLHQGLAGLLLTTPLLAAPLAHHFFPQKGSGVVFGGFRAMGGAWVERVLVPVLAGCVAIKIDLFAHFAVWPIVVLLLLSGDGRWLGAYLGAMVLGGRGSLRTMRLVLGTMACGPTQLAITAIAIHTWSIPGEYAMALLLGAVLIETTVGARRSMARRLIRTEEEIERMTQE